MKMIRPFTWAILGLAVGILPICALGMMLEGHVSDFAQNRVAGLTLVAFAVVFGWYGTMKADKKKNTLPENHPDLLD